MGFIIIKTPKNPIIIADHLLHPTRSFRNNDAQKVSARGRHCKIAVALAIFILIRAVRNKIVQPISPKILKNRYLYWSFLILIKNSFLM